MKYPKAFAREAEVVFQDNEELQDLIQKGSPKAGEIIRNGQGLGMTPVEIISAFDHKKAHEVRDAAKKAYAAERLYEKFLDLNGGPSDETSDTKDAYAEILEGSVAKVQREAQEMKPADLMRLRVLEEQGQNRVTLLRWLDEQMGDIGKSASDMGMLEKSEYALDEPEYAPDEHG